MTREKDAVCACNVIHPEKLEKVQKSLPDASEFSEIANFFKVFGDPTRTKIVWALEQSELCVCDLAALLGMTKSAISHQLAYLREAAIVKNRREGKSVFYSLDDDHIKYVFDIARDHIKEEKYNKK